MVLVISLVKTGSLLGFFRNRVAQILCNSDVLLGVYALDTVNLFWS